MSKRKDKSFLDRVTFFDVVLALILTIGMFTMVYPFWNSFLVSIVPQADLLLNPTMIIPKRLDLSAYEYVFTESLIPRGFVNSFIISVSHAALNVILTVIGAYIFTKKFPGQKVFWVFVLIPSIIPGGLIPSYILMQKLHLINNQLALILPGCFGWSSALYMARFFRSVPVELEESAKIDGASEVRIVWQIIFPLVLPFIAVTALNSFVASWNSWYSGMIYMRSANKMPLATILRDLQQAAKNVMTSDQMAADGQKVVHSEAVRMACVMTATIPIMLAYPFAQKYFIGGLTAGAVKG
ncbi:MAG: carbohydrate ABC transporter permease [Clostridia bacterium]|nr:carbohydrate ABC transporter permease [Clostridia bacterium]